MSDPIILMERDSGGIRVNLRLCADGRVAITTEQDLFTRATFVPEDKALDAFYHPFYYLARADRERAIARREGEKDAEGLLNTLGPT